MTVCQISEEAIMQSVKFLLLEALTEYVKGIIVLEENQGKGTGRDG